MAKSTKFSTRIRSLRETLEIMADRRLFEEILRAAVTLKDDVRSGRLVSFEEAFKNRGRAVPRRRRS